MNIHFKITKDLLDEIADDLIRPHLYAAERVGFLFARQGAVDGDTMLLLSISYMPIPDDLYVNDPSVGARINSTAIRKCLQKSMDSGLSAVHVHFHHFSDYPRFSKTDEESLSRLIPSFHHANPKLPHGAIIMGRSGITGRIWVTKQQQVGISKFSIIGYPCRFDWR